MLRTSPDPTSHQLAHAALAYDRWFETGWGSYAFAIEWRALEGSLGPLNGALVLDVGCGTGRFTQHLEAAGAEVVGLDLDPGMLEIARGRAHGGLVHGGAEQLPFPAHMFDMTLAVTLLEFIAEPARVVAEMARVTRPGGRLPSLSPPIPTTPRRRWAAPWPSWRIVVSGSCSSTSPLTSPPTLRRPASAAVRPPKRLASCASSG